ncbi:hypothetical protein OIU85_009342 [Salix viminalis]|uniref:Uncharacterized protein n=1 Tax=Salix viminalis TaxID=40686 RepID=A0A9Q0NZL6_SALVM|nr:hypothetical protein OIU85_009342 [Salix viminalis]
MSCIQQKGRVKGAKDLSGQGWWPIAETGGADGAGLEEMHGRASPSNCCCCSSITLPLEETAHDVVAVGKEGSCWMRCAPLELVEMKLQRCWDAAGHGAVERKVAGGRRRSINAVAGAKESF